MSEEIRFFEVGPRDGLQNEPTIVDPARRVEMIERLVDAGVRDVEIGSFVHPDWVPQMAGTDEVAAGLRRQPGVRYWALVPNLKGLERALEAELEHVAVFMSATEAHNRKNLNRSLDDSLQALEQTIACAVEEDLVVRAYISTAFGCPFEGAVDFDSVLQIGDALLTMGADHLSLGDTIGAGGPPEIGDGCRRAVEAFGTQRVALHLHDTQGLAVANALVAFQEGVRMFDGAVGAMGGCPYAPGAAGNVGSEDLVNLFDHIQAQCPPSADQLCQVSHWLSQSLGFGIDARYYSYWKAHHSEDS